MFDLTRAAGDPLHNKRHSEQEEEVLSPSFHQQPVTAGCPSLNMVPGKFLCYSLRLCVANANNGRKKHSFLALYIIIITLTLKEGSEVKCGIF